MTVEGWLKVKGVDKDLPSGVAAAAAEAIVQMLPGEASSLEWLAGMHAAGELPAFRKWYMAAARHKGAGEFGFRRRPDATWQVWRPPVLTPPRTSCMSRLPTSMAPIDASRS
jgi:hypothetical protein